MKKSLVKFEVKGLAPSSNHALNRGRNGRVYPSKEYKQWKVICESIPVQKIIDCEFYEVERAYYFPIYYKNGRVRKRDVNNLDKYTDDELCKRLITYSGQEVDDCQIKTGSHDKRDCPEGEERTVWEIWAIGENA